MGGLVHIHMNCPWNFMWVVPNILFIGLKKIWICWNLNLNLFPLGSYITLYFFRSSNLVLNYFSNFIFSKNINYKIFTMNICNFFGTFSKLWTFNIMGLFTTFFFWKKRGEIMFHQIIGKKNVVNYWIPPLEWWTSLKQGTFGFPLIFVTCFPL